MVTVDCERENLDDGRSDGYHHSISDPSTGNKKVLSRGTCQPEPQPQMIPGKKMDLTTGTPGRAIHLTNSGTGDALR